MLIAKKFTHYFLAINIFFTSFYTQANKQEFTPNIQPETESLLKLNLPTVNHPNSLAKNSPKKTSQSHSVEVDEKILLQNPKLLKRVMLSVLLAKNTDQIAVILPIYNQLKDKENTLINYGNALIFHAKQKYNQAISFYRAVISENPNFNVARFDLALALFSDKQFASAHHQLNKLKSEKLSSKDLEFINKLITQIEKNEDWSFNASFYYRHENNINNVPKTQKRQFGSGTLTFDKPQKARGFHLSASANKKFNLATHWFSTLNIYGSFNHFFNISKYNDYYLQIGTGIGYQTADYSLQIKPFLGRKVYANKAYSKSFGFGLSSYYKINHQWTLSNYSQWSDESYDRYKHLNGERYNTNFSIGYSLNAKQHFLSGLSYHKNSAKHLEDEFNRKEFFVGWQQEWPYGISSNLRLSAAKKDYYGVDFFNIKRSNEEYASSLSLWHRDFHFWGITPKFTWEWTRIKSNHFYYDKIKNQFYFRFSKTF